MKFKRKTSKSARKRYSFSTSGKIRRRSVGVNHFNAKDSGSQRRHRREVKFLSKNDAKKINQLLPYNLSAN